MQEKKGVIMRCFPWVSKDNIPVASDEMKSKILQAMAKSNSRAQDFVGYFSGSQFVLLPCVDPNNGCRVWGAQRGDVTLLVRERGTNVQDWVAEIQCW